METSWEKALRDIIDNLPAKGKMALIGVGSDLNGDDAMGPMVLDILGKAAGNARAPWLLLLDGGAYPEALSGELKRSRPDVVVVIDAVVSDAYGRCFIKPLCEAGGEGGFTHKMPLGMFAGYLTAETGASVWLLGIPLPKHRNQTEPQIAFGTKPSEAAKRKSRMVAGKLAALLGFALTTRRL